MEYPYFSKKMTIIDRYIVRSIAISSTLALLGLVTLMAFINFLNELNELGNGAYSFEIILQHILLLTPSFFNSLLILAIMMGVIFAVGEFNSNREIQIFQTASISLSHLVNKCLVISFLLSIFLISFFEIISPDTFKLAHQIKNQALGKPIVKFNETLWFKDGNKIFNISNISPNGSSLRVFTVDDKGRLVSFSFGKQGNFLDNKFIEPASKTINFSINNQDINSFPTINYQEVKIPLEEELVNIMKLDIKESSLKNLFKSGYYSYTNGLHYREYAHEIIIRLIRPFTLIGMILASIPIILRFGRSISVSNRIFISLMIGLITNLLSRILSVISLKFDSLEFVGPMIPTLLLISFGYVTTRNFLKR